MKQSATTDNSKASTLVFQVSDCQSWEQVFSQSFCNQAIEALESGKIIYFPNLAFNCLANERALIAAELGQSKAKNISFNSTNNILSGIELEPQLSETLKYFMKRYSQKSSRLLKNLFPHYQNNLTLERTSYRPAQISGRKVSSYRKDDTLLHVDAFQSAPTGGRRILRVFTNLNPNGEARHWKVGEPFERVAEHFMLRVSLRQFIGKPQILQLFKITKNKRTNYDHIMLQLHDIMKADENYQAQVMQQHLHFAPGSSWVVYTDQVSHAALSGQFALEQTFSLPPNGLKEINKSPLMVLEKLSGQKLI
jgi:hypothetical protein